MILLVDGGNLAMRCLFSSRDSMSDETFRLFKYIYFNTLFANIKKFHPNELVLALDGRGYWRRDVYDGYKRSRKKSRDDSPVDFDKFFEVLDEFIDKMRVTLPFKIIRIPTIEADDIIALICRKIKGEKVIVSTDRDFSQLLNLKNIRLYDPIRKKWIESDSPKDDLFVKILAGDPGDEVPSIKKGIGEGRARKIVCQGVDEIKRWIIHEGLQTEFQRNNQLVNLFRIPETIENQILEAYQEYNLPDPQIAEFIYDVGFRYFIDRLDMTEGILLGLYQ